MTAERPGLRERKKQATREALRTAALRLAMECGPDNVRVDDIAAAAGVSPRTYNNYFSSREQAIVAAVTAERAAQVAAAVAARPAEVGLGDAVRDAVVGQYTDQGDHAREALLMITTSPALRACYVDTVTAIEEPLADAVIARCPDIDPLTAQVLSAAVGAAARVALGQWLDATREAPSMPGFVVPSGSLPDLVRAAVTPLVPALDAAGSPRA
ncbi:TetR/AcrR family transcriptional regulator [Micromonospora endophytica]|uniref:TetR family transcriptional regulator n=1 Tax=Micromonospora endophytica TaxID=515350 RepID=A0A2W2CFW9_9ACTN|nr:TetR/AcrR family transcriptional regulator [Micromonospora endophytica]PZF96700.1 TetR family transcriptional regulator [Micromonospora endophytica]RIW42551.1 TetR/AcrR family transcriptional regulator [Micromonospora endophytica]BCJ57476.1 TetR family transcriptional regulator [Micromonospora endophytica]